MPIQEQEGGTLEGEEPPDISEINGYYEEQEARKKAILTLCTRGSGDYCFGKEILEHARKQVDEDCCVNHRDDCFCSNQQRLYDSDLTVRTLMQMRGILEERYVDSSEEGKNIGTYEAGQRWIRSEKAKKFREKYGSGLVDTHHVLESIAQ